MVKAYRDRVDVAVILRDATAIEAAPPRVSRVLCPFPGTFYAPPTCGTTCPTAASCSIRGSRRPPRRVRASGAIHPNSSTLYRLGTLLVKSGQPARARAAFERALAIQPDLAEASNDLGTLLAQGGDLPARSSVSGRRCRHTRLPDALNNLGYALLLTGRERRGARAVREGAGGCSPTSRKRSTTSG